MRPFFETVARIFQSMGDDNIALLSGGIAFYAFLSIFPGIAFALIIWGLFNDADQLAQSFNRLADIVPPEAFHLIANQLVEISEAQNISLSWGAVVSLVLVMWSSSRAVNALLSAMWVTSNHEFRRGFLRQNVVAVAFTIVGIVYAAISLVIVGAVQPFLDAFRLGSWGEATAHSLRWLLMFGLFFTGILIFYRIAHPRDSNGLRIAPDRLWPGALLAAIMWLLASIAFSFYLRHFDALNETFGSLGAVVALLMWLWITAFAICTGAETNAELAADDD